MNLPCQVLSNLRNCEAWIDFEELRELFQDLVGEPSPSYTRQFDTEKLEEIDSTAYSFLSKIDFSIVVAHAFWFVHSYKLSIADATEIEQKINEHCPTFIIQVVPDEATRIMEGLEVGSVSFDSGHLIISSMPKVPSNHVIAIGVVDNLNRSIRNNNYLWNELGLCNFQLENMR